MHLCKVVSMKNDNKYSTAVLYFIVWYASKRNMITNNVSCHKVCISNVYHGKRHGIVYTDKVFSLQTRYFLYRQGIFYTDKVVSIQTRYFLYRQGNFYTDKVLSLQKRLCLYRQCIFYTDKVFSIQTR